VPLNPLSVGGTGQDDPRPAGIRRVRKEVAYRQNPIPARHFMRALHARSFRLHQTDCWWIL